MRLVRLHKMILEHLEFLRNMLNSLTLFQRYVPHKKHHLVKKKLTLTKKQRSSWKEIDYACLRNYSVKTLLAYEIESILYYLLKNGHLRKAKKSKLRNALRKPVPVCPSKVPNSSMIVAIRVDFIRRARIVPIKKLHLRTYRNLASHLWNTFI